jgi:hypothetical protein
MGYLTSGLGCGRTCACASCRTRSPRLGERYIRDDNDDDETEQPQRPPRSAEPSAGQYRRRSEARLGSVAEAAVAQCPFSLSDARALELLGARETLRRSAEVANRFVRNVGALSARGRFIPTVLDDKYWFAKLYEYITYYEIAEHPRYENPAFVLHFIPIFYNLYATNLDNFLRGDHGRVSSLWLVHFRAAGRPTTSSAVGRLNAVAASIRTGVEAHVRGDMAMALEQAYRSFVRKYCLTNLPFDRLRRDFFEANRPVFDRSKAAFLLHLSQMGPLPVGPEIGQFLLASGEQVGGGGLSIAEIYRWREQAWQEARRRLGR